MNKVFMLRQVNSMNYYSDILNGTHCVYGFLNRHSALKCKEFLIRYKKVYNRYPFIGQVIVTKYSGAADTVILDENNLEEMKNKCILNGIHLIGIRDFEYSDYIEEVNFSGEILTEHLEVPDVYIRDNLEHLITFSL